MFFSAYVVEYHTWHAAIDAFYLLKAPKLFTSSKCLQYGFSHKKDLPFFSVRTSNDTMFNLYAISDYVQSMNLLLTLLKGFFEFMWS